MTAAYSALEQSNQRDNLSARDALLNNGLKEVKANPDDIPYWYSVADKTNAETWAANAQDKELLSKMMADLAKYRAATPAGEPVARTTD